MVQNQTNRRESKYYFLAMEIAESVSNFLKGLFGFEPFSDQNKISLTGKFFRNANPTCGGLFRLLVFFGYVLSQNIPL